MMKKVPENKYLWCERPTEFVNAFNKCPLNLTDWAIVHIQTGQKPVQELQSGDPRCLQNRYNMLILFTQFSDIPQKM